MAVRLYDPRLGRFLEVDPVEGGSANDYDYVAGDPVNLYDLSGEKLPCFSCAAGHVVNAAKAVAKNPVVQVVATTGACTFGGVAGCLAAQASFSVVNNWDNCAHGVSRACAVGVGVDVVGAAVNVAGIKTLPRVTQVTSTIGLGAPLTTSLGPTRSAVGGLVLRNAAVVTGVSASAAFLKNRFG